MKIESRFDKGDTVYSPSYKAQELQMVEQQARGRAERDIARWRERLKT